FVENVGNLVCPAEFEIGTTLNVIISSVPEGEDKPLKYPLMFQKANICILNKTDLLPHTDFNLERFKKYIKDISSAQLIPLSVKTGDGVNIWTEKLSSLAFNWLSEKIEPLSIDWKGRMVIVGMGDRMKGDDGAGSLIAEKLSRTIKRKDIRIIDAGNAIENYIGLIEKFRPDTVVVIDAVDFGGSAGEIKIMDCDELQEITTSTHTFSLPLLISHIKTETGARCKVIGIQPKKIGISEDISTDIQKSIKKVIEDISFVLCR
ncbi:MAG TPA: hydrogenase maturation protease, partial [bacterium]|nr:hydrogenase maturation protease [bacterium]